MTKSLEQLNREVEDLEMDISFLEDELSSKQSKLNELLNEIEEAKDPVAYAQKEEDEAALNRQLDYLIKRYGSSRVRTIRDYWVKQ